ncbi:aminotransferase class V-fold PLP-dependent enzyme [Oceanobacillus sojae]|uniref:Putative aminotransferase YcbU n=1 Tax=Oceanobacillus sojae TaxID=582851 RepID=A0A511ZF88_9BACI|nr:aminotransferase class V-fold PLP-dependent enzyme [Oceanobacillus sojae]GEN86118.1 putative aminotransferase YcbU [Oceanobacillus sojae]
MNEEIISQFPTLTNRNYLAGCSQGLLPASTSNAITAYHEELLADGANWNTAMGMLERARESFAALIGAEPDEIAVVSSVSHAISAIATAFPDALTRDEIIFTDLDFPTVADIWTAQTKFQEKLHMISSEHGVIPLASFEERINEKTLLTSIPHVHYKSGMKLDIKEIAEIARRKGSLLFVDAYQSAGHCPIDVKEMGIDFLATGTRKYLLGIPGIAFLYINKGIADNLYPGVTGWLGKEKEGARKFDSGTPSFISAYAAKASLDFIQSIGVPHIAAYLEGLGAFTVQYGSEKGLRIYGTEEPKNRTSLVAFVHPQAAEVVNKLQEKGIVLTAKENIIRISPHVYNTRQDIKRAIDEIVLLTERRDYENLHF